MKKLLAAMFVALLMVGCGEDADTGKESPLDFDNGHKEQAVIDKWAEWEADPEPYGGLEILAKIKEAEDNGTTGLDLVESYITDISPLKGLTKLEGLSFSNNLGGITDLSPLKGLTNLERLHLDSNEITDLSPLESLTNLKELSLENNEITDLSPLESLTDLEKLTLFVNEISDISPLKGLTNLEYLNLDRNQITDVSPLNELTNLKTLWLYGNPIPEEQKAMIKKARPDCKIYFD